MVNRIGLAPVSRRERRAVNLSLDADLVTRARGLTSNLSGTVEALLTDYVREAEVKRHEEQARLEQTLAWLDALHEREGLLSDEFPSL